MSEAQYGLIAHGGQVPLTGVEVHADVAGRSARVRVLQDFTNAEDHPVEALYRFPLPEGASLCGFLARVDGRIIESEVDERDKAFERYDDAMMRGHGAYLLDQERPNIFTLSVGNLNPGKSAQIEIVYVTLLDCSGGDVRFYLPTTISPRYLPAQTPDRDGIPENDRIHPTYAPQVPYGLRITVDIHEKGGVSSVSSPSHPVRCDIGDEAIRVEFSAGSVAMDRDFVLTITGKDGVATRGFVWRRGEDTFVQVDFSPRGEELGTAWAVRPEDLDIVFVLDCSGSMQGSSIAQAKKALELFLKGLENGTTFNIYTFGSTFKKMAPSGLRYSEATLAKAMTHLEGIDANMGGTEVMAPLADIYADPVCRARKPRIVLITDGEVGNEQDVMELVRANAAWATVFTVGIGYGPNEHFIKGMARAAGGASEMIAPGERIEPKVLGLFGKVMGERIDGLALLLGPDCQQAPADAVAFTGETRSLFARVQGSQDVPAEVEVRGTLDGRERRWSIPLRTVTEGGDLIPLLWAREAIRDLEEGARSLLGSRQAERKERARKERIVALSKEFGIVSSQTSFLAVERRAEDDRTTEAAVLRKVPVLLTKGWHGVDRWMLPGTPADVVCDVEPPLFAPCADYVASSHVAEGYDRPAPMTLVSPRARRRPQRAPRGAGASDAEIVIKILSLQRADGGFHLDREVCRLLGVGLQKIMRLADQVKVAIEVDRFLLLSTALALEILEVHFASQAPIWKEVVRKSESWLRDVLSKASPTVDGQQLMAWARDFAQSQVRVPAKG